MNETLALIWLAGFIIAMFAPLLLNWKCLDDDCSMFYAIFWPIWLLISVTGWATKLIGKWMS